MIESDALGPDHVTVYVSDDRLEKSYASHESGLYPFKGPVDDALRDADGKNCGAEDPQVFVRCEKPTVFKGNK